MTAIAAAGERRGWRKKLVWVALALSLTLNICFLGGLGWSVWQRHAEAPMVRFLAIARDLKLDPAQRASMQQFTRTIRERGRVLRQSNEPLLQQIWLEMAKPQPDQALVARLSEQVTDNRRAFQKDASTALATFLATLNPEQRAEFAAVAMRRNDQVTKRLWQFIAP